MADSTPDPSALAPDPGVTLVEAARSYRLADANGHVESVNRLEGPTRRLIEAALEYERQSSALAVRVSPPPQTWQPIETAPKDGTEIVLFVPSSGPNKSFVQHGRWVEGVDDNVPFHYWSYGYGFLTHVGPTHWMPLPLAPETPEPKP